MVYRWSRNRICQCGICRNVLLSVILLQQPEPFLSSVQNHERKGAIQTVKAIFNHFLESVSTTVSVQILEYNINL